jgi:hypothetical protein
MNWFLDVFSEDESSDNSMALAQIERIQREDWRHGPCEDDCETLVETIGMMPEESDHENGSPLNFRR